MKALLVLMLMSGVYASTLMTWRPVTYLSNDLADSSSDETSHLTKTTRYTQQNLEDAYFKNMLNNKHYVKLRTFLLDKLQNKQAITDLENSELQRTAYMLLNTIKQRVKRYTTTSYKPCYFKVCPAWPRTFSTSKREVTTKKGVRAMAKK
ncbi:hypothetical protein Trydic_g16949 [Trypoxylus dichotomus]